MRKGQGDAGAPRWAVPTPGSRLSCTPSVIVNARGIGGDAGATRPRPSPEGRMALWTLIRGDWGRVEGPGARRVRRACGGHASQRARRDAKHARLPLSVTAAAVTPSPPGKGLGCARSGGAPLRSPRFAHACALRHGRERRRPPAEADGGYSCSSGHASLRRTAPFLTCPSTPADKPRTPDTPTTPRATRAAHRCRPPASG